MAHGQPANITFVAAVDKHADEPMVIVDWGDEHFHLTVPQANGLATELLGTAARAESATIFYRFLRARGFTEEAATEIVKQLAHHALETDHFSATNDPDDEIGH